MKIYLYLVSTSVIVMATMPVAAAIPPPDFLVNFGSSLAQVFAVVVLFLSALIASVRQFAGTYFKAIKKKTWLWILLAIMVIGVALAVAYWYERDQQREAFDQWVEEQKITKSLPEAILTNEEFSGLLGEDIFVLDAREDEEYGIGYLPGSEHIRFADLIDGAWEDLPRDQEVYVICWSGIRGSEVTEFLRSKGVKARYLENGASDWVENGGLWEGEIKFSKVYSAYHYNSLMSAGEFDAAVANGAVVVDSRELEKYQNEPFASDYHIPTFHTPSDQLNDLLAEVPANSLVVTICDEWVNCFDAKITGIKLEKLGHNFIGRYEK